MSEVAAQEPNESDDLIVKREQAVIQFLLNRPRALNALNHAMKVVIADTIPVLARDANLYAVVYGSSSQRGFCAGGDIRELTALAREDMAAAREALATEYRLNWLLDCFSKPSIAMIDGIVMGSGVGLTHFCTHRVGTENYKFAMPETAVGFFPDVGMAHVLARLPNHVGMYLALTGRSIGRADAHKLGLVSHCFSSDQFDDIVAALADSHPVDPILDDRHIDPGPGELDAYLSIIGDAFSAPSLPEIINRLAQAVCGHDERRWVDQVRHDLAQRSPTALMVTHRHLQTCRSLDLRQNLILDYRLGCHFLNGPDFYEGVRAVLVEKDGNPQWRPKSLSDVSSSEVDRFFASLDEDELDLPTRAEMQASRV